MTVETVKKLRKELHHLVNDDRNTYLPLLIMFATTNYVLDESTSLCIWDDVNEILYAVSPNTIETSTLDSRVLPSRIDAYPYENILKMAVRVDRSCLDNFLKDKVAKGLTDELTRKEKFKEMTDLFDERTYFMGQPSPTTEKRGIRPDDQIFNIDNIDN